MAESEGTLILPQVESFHRLHDDDATTVTSDDSFFSAAEVGSLSAALQRDAHICCTATVFCTLRPVCVCLFCLQLFDAMALEDVYPPLKPAALYEEALALVRENKVSYRSLR